MSDRFAWKLSQNSLTPPPRRRPGSKTLTKNWIPAFAGMTDRVRITLFCGVVLSVVELRQLGYACPDRRHLKGP